MKKIELSSLPIRNFDTISPSAKSLLLMKGYTKIPFARKAAELISYPAKYNPDFDKKDITFWSRVAHFENRYLSINQLLYELSISNILELSSGFSFRGFETIRRKECFYIDTDLPNLISIKKRIISDLNEPDLNVKGKLKLLPLNALDKKQFNEVVSSFPPGEIIIVNEGLLMYLNANEKEELCSIIHQVLKERGGYWITADIYIKNAQGKLELKLDEKTKAFFKQHRIEENKFNSFEEAKKFFEKMGFAIDKESKLKTSEVSSFKYLLKNITDEQLDKLIKVGKMQTSWRLHTIYK
jgi:O-methyltransferase involved in polyketide biosynthesis